MKNQNHLKKPLLLSDTFFEYLAESYLALSQEATSAARKKVEKENFFKHYYNSMLENFPEYSAPELDSSKEPLTPSRKHCALAMLLYLYHVQASKGWEGSEEEEKIAYMFSMLLLAEFSVESSCLKVFGVRDTDHFILNEIISLTVARLMEKYL